MLKIWNSIRPT